MGTRPRDWIICCLEAPSRPFHSPLSFSLSLCFSYLALGVSASHTKAKQARTIPLNQAARQALLDQRDEQSRDGLQTPYVFAHINARWRGQRIANLKNSFASACKRAGLKSVTPHTLRHTCALWLVMAGRPILEVRDILGHSTIKMTERYAHLAPENLVDAVSSIEDRLHFGSTAMLLLG